MKHKLINDGQQKTFAIIMDSGDEVMECMESFARQKHITAAQFSAIGALSEATVGFYDFSIKDYKKTEFKEQVEVLNVTGGVSLYQGEIKLHAHIVLGKPDGSAHGGHFLKGIAHPTLEVILTESPAHLKREMDEDAGIPLIKI